MTGTTPETIHVLRAFLRERLGLRLETTKDEELAGVVRDRVRATGAASAAGYVARLALEAPGGVELGALAARLTVGETYFFRNSGQLRALVTELASPAASERRRDELRILSAGCSSGEEAYSIAIQLRESLPDGASRRIAIHGVDVNPAVVERARAGRYGPWSLRSVAPELRARWFTFEGREHVVARALRAVVTFDVANLVERHPLLAPRSFDAIFFRNVAIYLTPEATRSILERMASLLVPGGLLFLGDAETTRNLSDAFEPVLAHDTFYFRLAGQTSGAAPELPAPPEAVVEPVVAIGDAIAEAPVAERDEPAARRDEREIVERAREHIARERFAAALGALDALSAPRAGEPDVVLLRAVALASSGATADAERACDALIARDPLDARVHYVKALCREHAGDTTSATEHDRRAIFLDAGFVMPRIHLGILARRSGDRALARRAMAAAVERLPGEDAARLALFGGGFDREALIALCRAELEAAGGGAA